GPDGARPKDVAAALGVSRAAATTFIQRLELKGLVETTPDPEDDRGVRVTLTCQGLEVLLRVGQLERRLAARAIEGLPASGAAWCARRFPTRGITRSLRWRAWWPSSPS